MLKGAAVRLCHHLPSAEWDLLARDQVTQRGNEQPAERSDFISTELRVCRCHAASLFSGRYVFCRLEVSRWPPSSAPTSRD